MPEFCSCGTTLVENARFCHRCGKPTFEMEAEVVDTVDVPVSRMPLAAGPGVDAANGAIPVSFKNPIALRVAFLMSVGILFIEMVPGVNVLFVVWWLAAGWGAVALYKRLTGFTLSVASGARLGSITGVMTFLSMTAIIALTMVVAGKELFEQMVKQNPQIQPVLNDPVELGIAMLLMLALFFGMVVGTCAAGGALGARFAARAR